MSSIKKGNGSCRIGMLSGIISGAAAASLVSCIVVLIGPIFILNEYLEPRSVHIIAIVLQAVGSLIGALIAGSVVSDKKWAAAGASAGLFYVILVCGGILFFESDPGEFFAGLLSCAVGVACSLLLLKRMKKTQIRKKIRHRSR